MADNTIANAIKFLKGEEKSLPATKTEGQVYFAYKNVGTAEKPSYTGAIYIDTPIGGTQNRIKMTANADIADKAFNDSAGLNIRDTYVSSLGYTDDGKQTILIKGSGNNQTRIALPIASTTKSGIVSTDAQSFNGTKTFTTINSTNLTVTGSNGFNYSSIGAGTADVARPVWFADNSGNGKPVINTNFTYNPATQTLSVANLSGTADKANKDNAGNDIRSTYISNITVNGTTLTFTKGGGATSSITLQDTNNKVTQTAIKSSDYTNWRTVLWGASNSATEGFAPTTVTDGAFTSDTLTFQPSSGTLKAKTFKGNLSGNASTATTATMATKLQTYKRGSTTETYGTNFPVYAQWQTNTIVKLKCDGNSTLTDRATLLNPIYTSDTLTTETSTWRGDITDGKVVWGQRWKDTSLSNDAGDLTLWLNKVGNLATINMVLDGTVTAVQGFNGDLIKMTPQLCASSENNEITIKVNDNKIFSNSTGIANASLRNAIDFKWYDTNWQIGNIRGSSTDSIGFGFAFKSSSSEKISLKSYIDTNGVYHGGVDKLATARKISLTGDATGSAIFNGETDISISAVTRQTCFVGSDSASSSGWYKVASQTMSGYGDSNIMFAVTSTYSNYYTGIFSLQIRSDNTSIQCPKAEWLVRSGFSADSIKIVISGMTWTMYVNRSVSRYGRIMFEVLTQSSINGKSSGLTMYNTYTKESVTPNATKTSSDGGTVNYANSAGSVAWGNVSGRPSSMPASDVYAWAKASTKPTYTKAEIGLGNVDNTADSQKSVKYSTTSGSATTTTKLQTYKQGSTTETYGTQYPLYAQWEDNSNLRLKVDNYTVKVNYADKAGSASSATNAATATKLQTARTISLTGSVTGSGTFDGSGNLSIATSTNHSHSQYLPLAGGTMTGTVNFTATKLACNFRPNSSAYCTGIMHQTDGNEALVFAAANTVTSFIFKCGQDPIGMTSTTWTGITPSMQIKKQSVYINSLIANNVTPGYNLYVNGTTRCNGTLGVGNGSSAEIDFFPNSASTIGARIKAYNDRIEFVFS